MRVSLLITLLIISIISCHQSASPRADDAEAWQNSVDSILPLYGHRNWVLVIDKAFPALVDQAGVLVINTDADMLSVLKYTNDAIRNSTHVTPHIYMDKEFVYLPAEKDTAIAKFKNAIEKLFVKDSVLSILHDSIFTQLSEVAKNFQVLVLKTNSKIAYSSVCFQLDCKYWNAEKERLLRATMLRPK